MRQRAEERSDRLQLVGSDPAVVEKAPKDKHLSLTPAERKIALLACRRYRALLPSYLKSSQRELKLVASVIRKLT